MIRNAWLIAGTVVCVASGACALHRKPKTVFDTEARNPDSVVVRVQNHFPHRLVIAIAPARGGAATRLGEVDGKADGRFPLRAAAVTRELMILVATPIAGHERLQSVPFHPRRGQVVLFTITPDLAGSALRVRWPREP